MLLGLPYEVWRDIPRYKGEYEVSTKGNVNRKGFYSVCKSVYGGKKERYLKPKPRKIQTNGRYLFVQIKRRSEFVHRLVAETFIPNPLNLPQVNHKDENPFNNQVSNLEWCDSVYNNNYGTKNERASAKMKGRYNNACSKPVLQFTIQGEFLKEWSSMREIERQLGFETGGICRVCKGVYSHSHGYVWRYKEEI